jgi:isoleucyl-tRNA synthetase
MLNPILPFTMDEFNKNLPGERVSNVQLKSFPSETYNYDEELLDEYKVFNKVRSIIQKALEEAKNEKIIRSSQDAHVYLSLNNETYKSLFEGFKDSNIEKLFVVSEVTFVDDLDVEETDGLKVKVIHHEGHRCERCWNYSDDTIELEDGTHICPRCKKVVGK